MIKNCIDYLELNGYYCDVDEYMGSEIAFKVAEKLCVGFTDKNGNEVPDDVFNVLWGLIKSEL